MSYIMVGSGVASIAGGLIGGGKARRARRRARKRRRMLEKKLTELENNRQAVINPYAGVTNLSSLAQDLSNKISNPFANLSVATQAAEMKIDQSNIALANTLDTLRATGASAGGATVLAEAALKAKQGVAASIEAQEKANEDKRAQGQQQMEMQKVAEARRLQGIQLSEGQRIQQAEAAGKQFVFSAQEQREVAKMNRVASQISGAARAEAQAAADQTSAITGMFGSLAQLGGQRMGAS